MQYVEGESLAGWLARSGKARSSAATCSAAEIAEEPGSSEARTRRSLRADRHGHLQAGRDPGGRRDHGEGGAGAARRARGRGPAPRRQAREHHDQQGRRAGAHGLRSRPAGGQRAADPDPDRRSLRHAGLHVARAADAAVDPAGSAHRRLVARGHPLRVPDAAAPLRGADARGALPGDPDQGAAGSPEAQPGGSPGSAHRAPDRAREGPRPPLPERARASPRICGGCGSSCRSRPGRSRPWDG